ncbi:Ephrin-A2 [Dissostichus eleginoides]|uniref:Ephrin-A2 n=1 Tax=Dissostichus eleginoides TaxID=100907 RepID=A0AAD9C4A3_DISEL|nr:Ephrin-A2 [Dissostichus eleginoides]
MSMMVCQLGQRCVMVVVLLALLSWVSVWAEEKIIFDRHAVYWNSSNPKSRLVFLIVLAERENRTLSVLSA